jgi:hypothetical protein
MSILRVLHTELLKLRRTLAFRVIFVLPLLVALLQFFALWRARKFGAGGGAVAALLGCLEFVRRDVT